MANKYLDCTLPNTISLGDGSQSNPYNLYWTWNNVDTGNDWYVKGIIFENSPGDIQIKPKKLMMWDYYSPFVMDGILKTNDIVSEIEEITGGIGDFEVMGRAEVINASILCGAGTADFLSGKTTKLFNCCTFYTTSSGSNFCALSDNSVDCEVEFKTSIFNGTILSCNNLSADITIRNCATDRVDLNTLVSGFGHKYAVYTDYSVIRIPFLTVAIIIANPKTEKENIRYSKLIDDGYTSSGLDSANKEFNFGGTFDDGVYGFFGGRRYGRGAIWFDNFYYIDLSVPNSLGNGCGDEDNKWGYLDFLEFMNSNIVARQKIREADKFYIEGEYTWIVPLNFPSFRNISMKTYENEPNTTDYIQITFKRAQEGVPITINSPTNLIDFGTNNRFEFLIFQQDTLGADVRFNKFIDCIFFHPTEIKVPAVFVGGVEGVVTFERCDFITPRIYMKGEPTNDPANFSAHFLRCALYGYNTEKIKIKADSYSELNPVKIGRVIHIANDTILRNGPFNVYGNIFTEASVEWDGWCSGSVFHGGYWAAVNTSPSADIEKFRGDYDFAGGFKTEVDTYFSRTSAGEPDPISGEVHIRDTFGVTDTADLQFEPAHPTLNIHCDALHDPDTLGVLIDQLDSSTFHYNDVPFTGLGNVTGTTLYNGGGAFDFSQIPKQFSERPQQVIFDWNHPDVQSSYVNWTVVRTALGIPAWQKQLTVPQLELAYIYCVVNNHMIGQFALIVVNDLLVPKPSWDPNEAFQNHILFVVTAHIYVQNLSPIGFWNCAETSSINMIIRSGGQLTFGGPVYNDGLYRGMILAEPGSSITMGQNIVNLRTIKGSIYDFSTSGITNWYSQESGIDIFYDIQLIDILNDLGIFTNLGGTTEAIKVTTIKVEECYYWPNSVDLNETPDDLTITEVSNNNDTNLLQTTPTVFANIIRNNMIFDDYNNSDNLINGTEVVSSSGIWGSVRVDDSVGVWASTATPIPRSYYVDTTELDDGDGTELDPFQLSQYIDYMGGIGTYSIVSGDQVFIYGPLGGEETDKINVVCGNGTIQETYAWYRYGITYPSILGFNIGSDNTFFEFSGSPENVNFQFYNIIFAALETGSYTKLFSGIIKSTFNLFNCLVSGDIYFNPGIERFESTGEPVQNTINYTTSTITTTRIYSITGRVYWDDVVVRAEYLLAITPEELFINGAEISFPETIFNIPAGNKTNILWESVPAGRIPYNLQINGTSDLFTADDFLWSYLGFTNTGRSMSQWITWNVPAGMEGYTRQGVGYLSFKPSGRNLYVDFTKIPPGDGSQLNPWTRSQFLTYFGNAGYEAISTFASRGDTLWCRNICYVYSEAAFIPFKIDTKDITVRGWDIDQTHVILVDFSDSEAAEKKVVDVESGRYMSNLRIKDFFFFINNDSLNIVDSDAAAPSETPNIFFYNSSFQVHNESYLYLNKIHDNDTITNLIGCTIKVETIRTWAYSNNIKLDNTVIYGEWENFEP